MMDFLFCTAYALDRPPLCPIPLPLTDTDQLPPLYIFRFKLSFLG